MENIDCENWHETNDNALLYLHKDLGMPIRLTWLCNNAINMLVHTEMLDKSYGESRWRNKFDVDLFIITVPTYFSQLGDEKTRKDHKLRNITRTCKNGLQGHMISDNWGMRRHARIIKLRNIT
jgi:hypothetical protein